MKLHDCPRNSLIRAISDIQVPPAGGSIQEQEILKFHHLDGMYSYCTNKAGEVVHLVAWADIEIIDTQKGCSWV